MIKVKDLVFDYMTKRALHGISFEIEKGSIIALIGPNGAGKTTLMRCLAGLVKPFGGEIFLNDINIPEDSRNAHKHISYLSDVFGLYDNLTARQCLRYAAMASDVAAENIETAVTETAELLNLTEHLDTFAGNLSRGLRQRLAIALGIIHKPEFIILDEPASGLDPEARLELSRLFITLKERGHTLLISSHILSELEDYATGVLVLDNGRLVKDEDFSDMPEKEKDNAGIPVDIRVRHGHEKLAAFLKQRPDTKEVSFDGIFVRTVIKGGEAEQYLLLKDLLNADFEIIEFMTERSALKTAYFDTLKKGE